MNESNAPMDPNRIYEITRYISKNGGIGLVSDDTIEWARSLSDSDKVALYCRVRDESQRMESEWREEFVERIDMPESSLPEIVEERIDLAEFLTWAASHEDRGEVMDTLEELLEDASDDEIELMEQLVLQTSQPDLLPVVAEFRD